jgi:hypothetical protein
MAGKSASGLRRKGSKAHLEDGQTRNLTSPGMNAASLGKLQQQLGNRAVQRMMGEDSSVVMRDAPDMPELDLEARPELPSDEVKTESSAEWTERYPESADIDDLDDKLSVGTENFINVVEDAGADVEIIRTLVPPERAYLMHWSYRIAKEGFNPDLVPYMEDVDIRWSHDDPKLSRQAAWEMVNSYAISDLKAPPALVSPYTLGQVISMSIRWFSPLTVNRHQDDEYIIEDFPFDATNPLILMLAQKHELEYLFTVPDSDIVHFTIPIA